MGAIEWLSSMRATTGKYSLWLFHLRVPLRILFHQYIDFVQSDTALLNHTATNDHNVSHSTHFCSLHAPSDGTHV